MHDASLLLDGVRLTYEQIALARSGVFCTRECKTTDARTLIRSLPCMFAWEQGSSFWVHQLDLKEKLPIRRSARVFDGRERLYLSIDGQGLADRQCFPTPPPSGTVHTFPLLAFQLAVMLGKLARYQPRRKL